MTRFERDGGDLWAYFSELEDANAFAMNLIAKGRSRVAIHFHPVS